MKRHIKRQLERQKEKITSRKYSYEEILEIMTDLMKKTENECIARYSVCVANALSTSPLNFGKKRVCNTVQMIFDLLEGIHLGSISEEDVTTVASGVGVTLDRVNDKYEILVDSRSKKAKLTEKLKEIRL